MRIEMQIVRARKQAKEETRNDISKSLNRLRTQRYPIACVFLNLSRPCNGNSLPSSTRLPSSPLLPRRNRKTPFCLFPDASPYLLIES